MNQSRWWIIGLVAAATLGHREADGGWLFGNRGACGGQVVEARSPGLCMPICRRGMEPLACSPCGTTLVMLVAADSAATPVLASPQSAVIVPQVVAISPTSARVPPLKTQVFEWNPSTSGGGRRRTSSGIGFPFDSNLVTSPDPTPAGAFGGLSGGSVGSGGSSGSSSTATTGESTTTSPTLTTTLHLAEPLSRGVMDLGNGLGTTSGSVPGPFGPSLVGQDGFPGSASASGSTSAFGTGTEMMPGAGPGQNDHGGWNSSQPSSSVPEPSAITSTLIGLALSAGAWWARRKRPGQSTRLEDVARS